MADAKEDVFDNTYELTDEHFELFKEEFIYI